MTTKQAPQSDRAIAEQQLIEVLQYVQHLAHAEKSTLPSEPNPSDPPEFIGAVSHGSLLPT